MKPLDKNVAYYIGNLNEEQYNILIKEIKKSNKVLCTYSFSLNKLIELGFNFTYFTQDNCWFFCEHERVIHIDKIDALTLFEGTEFTEEIKTDSIVESVVSKYKDRSSVGIKKYNTTLEENKDGIIIFLNHLQEELMDATLYIEKIKNQFNELKQKL